MNRLFGCAGFVLCLLGIAGCGTGPEAVELPPPSVTLTAADVNRTTPLRIGEYAKISLKENPSTGYTWMFRMTDNGEKGNRTDGPVRLAGERYLPPREAAPPGTPGVRELMVRAEQPGRAALIGECRRSWERRAEPVMTRIAALLLYFCGGQNPSFRLRF